MSQAIGTHRITEFLAAVGQRLDAPAQLVLLGGGGLSLLGNPRPTLDLDFNGDEKSSDPLRAILDEVAREQQLDLAAVPLDRFLPLPTNAKDRHIAIGQFGNLHVYVFDPYSIALSKLDRGFDSDIEDVTFLLREEFIAVDSLRLMITELAEQANEYDLNLDQMQQYLELAAADLLGGNH